MIREIIKGDLITMALKGSFELIAHQTNCFSKQKSGIAAAMVKAFSTDEFKYEQTDIGSINKLGTVDYGLYFLSDTKKGKCPCVGHHSGIYKHVDMPGNALYVANLYGQYTWATPANPQPIDYTALELCFKKLNTMFRGYTVGIPRIGAGLAGGDWDKIQRIINEVTPHLRISVVEL